MSNIQWHVLIHPLLLLNYSEFYARPHTRGLDFANLLTIIINILRDAQALRAPGVQSSQNF